MEPEDHYHHLVEGCYLAKLFTNDIKEIKDFQVRDDDIWVCSFPKSGSTWAREMIWCICNDLDFEGAKVNLGRRSPFLDMRGLLGYPHGEIEAEEDLEFLLEPIDYLNKMKTRRIIKTHMPFHLLPTQLQTRQTKAKMIVVMRNPKDVCISYYCHVRGIPVFQFSFEEYCSLFLRGKVSYGPYDRHVEDYLNLLGDPNIFFLMYEDMKKDLNGIIRNVARFLGKELTNKDTELLSKHLSFDSMKKNPALVELNLLSSPGLQGGSVLRQGKVGAWKSQMPRDIVQRFDAWQKQKLPNFERVCGQS